MVAIDDLLCLWEERQENGEPITPEELCQQCPEMLGEVRWHIRALQAVESHFGGTNPLQTSTTSKTDPTPAIVPSGPVRISTEYHIERLHASGGLGHVFLATDPTMNRRVAIKFPKWSRLSNEQRTRFEREARVTGRLDHPGIVPVHSLKLDDPNRPCYVMRFVEGPTLHQTIRELYRNGGESRTRRFFYSFEFRHLLQNLISLNNIVAYAHGQGVIHRDIKPSNVILGPFGETLLLDWGLAKVMSERDEMLDGSRTTQENHASLDTLDGQMMGTPAFSSPEQLLGQTDRIDQRSDIYSLGVTLYFLLTGKCPVESGSLNQQIEDVVHGKIAPPREVFPSVPVTLQAICQHAMATDPTRRYQNVPAMTADLECFLAGEAVSVVSDPVWKQMGRTLRRRPGLFAATIATTLMTLMAGVIGSALLNQKNRELVRSNERLGTAVFESRTANQQALLALRSLVDDVVIRDLSESKTLDGAEREFLNRIFEQYSALATLQGESPESRAIRAEGLMQMGKIQLRLSEEQEALEKLEAAVALFQALVDETDKFESRLQLAGTVSELGEVLLRLGRLDQANERTKSGIALLDPDRLDAAEKQRAEPVLARLYLVQGTVEQGQRHWNRSRESLDEARKRLESLVKAAPANNAAHQQALAAVYRHLGETSAQLGDLTRQVQYSELALDLQRQLVNQFPDQTDYQLGLALACNNCSRHRETAGQITAAIEELNEALMVTERLATRFPQVARYRDTLAGLHARRGNLEWKQARVQPAESDLGQAIVLYKNLVSDFSDVPEYCEGLLQARLALADIKFHRNRVPAADRILTELFSDARKFSADFPEVASRSMTLNIARVQFTRVQLRRGRAADAIRPLELAKARFVKLGQSDDSANPLWWQAKTAMQLGRAQRALKQTTEALANFQLAAEILAKLAERHPGDFDLLSRLASDHKELSADFVAMGRSGPDANVHRQREIDLRVQIVQGAPNNPYYRVLYARSLKEQGDDFRLARKLPIAQDLYGQAAAVLAETIDTFPNDRLVRMTMGDLRASEGRVLFVGNDYASAETKFAEAVTLNPSLANRSSRANNLSRFRPEHVLEQVDAILADRIPDAMPLKSLLLACGTAANNLSDQNMQTAIGDRVVTMLQHMVDDDYLPHPDTIAQLRSGETFTVFQMRDDFNRLVNVLHERNLTQQSPEIIRSLPKLLQPTGHWFLERTVYDLSPEIWLWRGIQALRQ